MEVLAGCFYLFFLTTSLLFPSHSYDGDFRDKEVHFFTAILISKCRDYFYLPSLLLAIFSVNTVTYSPIAISKSFHCCTLHSSICYSSSFFFLSWLSSCFSQFLVERLMIYMYVCTPMYTHTYTDTYINTYINTYVRIAHNLLYTVNTMCVFQYHSQSCHFQLCNSTAGSLELVSLQSETLDWSFRNYCQFLNIREYLRVLGCWFKKIYIPKVRLTIFSSKEKIEYVYHVMETFLGNLPIKPFILVN